VNHDREEWQRPWRPDAGRPAMMPPALLDPQLSPVVWDDQTEGPDPASMPTSDTAAGVDAPPAARGRVRVGVLVLLAALVGGVVGTGGTLLATGALEEQAAPAPGRGAGGVGVRAPAIEPLDQAAVVPAVAEAVTPSVVRVDVRGAASRTGTGVPQGVGSGVIYRSDGYILTNHHVIQAAGVVTVRLANGDVLEAEIIGSDELNDLAVLRIDRGGLPAINLRPDDEPLKVGETVVAIGSPFGLDASVTAGIISALNRELRLEEQQAGGLLTIPSVIQTDAAINPGNSGGALVDARGRLVGINTAILSGSGANQGVGFAVSAGQAISSADQLIAQGFVRHPLLGITGLDVTPEVAQQFDLPASRGAVVDSVQDGTGAADAGLRPGDIILEVDGRPLATMSELVARVRARAPGDVLELLVFRDGTSFALEVELSERPR